MKVIKQIKDHNYDNEKDSYLNARPAGGRMEYRCH